MGAEPIELQLSAVEHDPLRVLVVGAGIAGTALTQLLRRQGLHPVLIERAAPEASSGYMLGLLPLADPVLDRLGATDAYKARSVRIGHYVIRGRHGQPIREYALEEVFGRQRVYRGISRADLLAVLTADGCLITHGTVVTALDRDDDRVRVTFQVRPVNAKFVDAEFDVVVAADGMYSATRGLVLRDEEIRRFDTGVGGWVGWIQHRADLLRFDELWGCGFFVGAYPVPGRIGVFVGGSRTEMAAGAGAFTAGIRRRLPHLEPLIGEALDVVERDAGYVWRMEDRRATRWSTGRVGLLGDAAVGFLPTAGIGAAMAIESAGLLAAALSGCRRGDVANRLKVFEHAQRPRSEAAQRNSQQLARLMFEHRSAVCALRDAATRMIPARATVRPIRQLLDQRPQLPV